MKKLIIIPLLLIVSLLFSQKDTTKLVYPRIAYPGEIVKDTCVEFSLLQAKLVAIDAINADSYKEQSDSLKSVINQYQDFVNLKNSEIQQLNFDISVRNDIITGYKAETKQYKTWFSEAENRLKLTKKVDAIVYPILGTLVLTGIVYIAISH